MADARAFSRKTENGTLCTNPPYGERLLEKEAAVELMRAFGKTMRETENWKTYVISSLRILKMSTASAPTSGGDFITA